MEPTVGQTLVHPQHGTTTVTGFETREIRGETIDYLVLRREEDELTVRIPREMTEDAGLRNIIDEDRVSEVYDVLESDPMENPGSWRKQHARNEKRINSGDVVEIAKALRDLEARLERRGTLSPTDRTLYREARERLIEELSAAADVDTEKVEERINACLEEAVSDIGEDD